MDKVYAKNIFEITEAFSIPGTEDKLCTGLGLILCKEFILNNKGVIRVKSVLNVGSDFWFSLPKSAPERI